MILFGALFVSFFAASSLAQQTAPSPALKIVVIEGEDAVNIVRQKTAVAPVVEVRDRNDQPVAGAVVRFAIQGGRASFNGARTLSVTTNIAGRAAASGLTPASSGAFQITVSAAFQGQTAVATIAQTNVLTAAQAASVTGASGAGGTGGGAGGGGLSATTIGIVGGAVAGGTLVTLKAIGGDEGVRYQGSFSINTITTIVNTRNGIIVGNCFWGIVIAGTITADLGGPADGTLRGDADVNWTESEVSRTCSTALAVQTDSWRQEISGPAASLQFNRVFTGPGGSGGTATRAVAFTGALIGEAITGTLTLSFSFTGIAPNGDAVTQGYPPSGAPVTLQKQ